MPDSRGRFLKGEHWRTRKPHWDWEWLVEQYVNKQRSTGDLAVECGCTDANMLFWLKRHGINRRTVAEARAIKHWGASGDANPMHGKIGILNPNYIDGSSPERQRIYARGDGREFLRDVLKRDGYHCRRCNAPKQSPKFLHVHHIKPWAGNPGLRTDSSNAVTLCRPCHSWVHSKANAAREYLA